MSSPHRAGASIEDFCRVCKELRDHRIIAVDGAGIILRVVCGYCGSDHHFRGGRAPGTRAPSISTSTTPRSTSAGDDSPGATLVSERERAFPRIDTSAFEDGTEKEGETMDLEMMLRRIIREESGLTPAAPAEKWRGGELVLKPGKPGVQDKSMPIDTFFHKVVMLRNRLRVLEQKINSSKLADDEKMELQGYVTGCYGTLTTFNVLFAEESEKFKGSGGD